MRGKAKKKKGGKKENREGRKKDKMHAIIHKKTSAAGTQRPPDSFFMALSLDPTRKRLFSRPRYFTRPNLKSEFSAFK